MKDKIIHAAKSPHELELLFRSNPKEFTYAFREAFAERPDEPVFQAWHERLFFSGSGGEIQAGLGWRIRDVWVTIILSLVAGTLAKLPQFFSFLDEERFYSRNLGAIVAGVLIVYFCIQRLCNMRVVVTLIALLAGGTAYLNLLPDMSSSQTTVLACMHMPLFFWSLLGVAFLGGAWKKTGERMDYLRYNGELLVYSTIILIGGMVLTGLTFALFTLIDVRIENWYMKNVVVYGSIAAPVVATLLVDRIAAGRFKIAPLLAKVFTPLFLLTVAAYLMAMIVNQKSPFTDRDFLMAFNGLLLVVLGLCVFSISERGSKETAGAVDVVNLSLVVITLLIDVVALAAILFRLSSYGFTPNRVAILGANLLTFGHLAGIFLQYARFIGGRAGFDGIEVWITRYIPAYTVWSLMVALGFPLIFWFK